MTIKGEQTFNVAATRFGISASKDKYTLMYSVDGKDFDAWEDETPAGENVLVIGNPRGMIFKLSGNTDTLQIIM